MCHATVWTHDGMVSSRVREPKDFFTLAQHCLDRRVMRRASRCTNHDAGVVISISYPSGSRLPRNSADGLSEPLEQRAADAPRIATRPPQLASRTCAVPK